MTQENKELLLKDLSARLPYGVKALGYYHEDESNTEYNPVGCVELIDTSFEDINVVIDGTDCDLIAVKPYLRLMSSMTDEEKKEIRSYLRSIEGQLLGDNGRHVWYFDYLNSRHLDYRRLINKGLALEAPEGMYN